MTHSARSRIIYVGCLALIAASAIHGGVAATEDQDRSRSVFPDYRDSRPVVVHKNTVADLPATFASPSVDNPPKVAPRPEEAMPQAPPGYRVSRYADGLENPRLLRTAPNGDLFVAE